MVDYGFDVCWKIDMLYYFVESYVGSFEFGYVKKNMERIIEYMVDGSVIFFVLELNEYYYFVKGVLMEFFYIFIDMGLKVFVFFVFYIFEIGFGMGLNVLFILIEVERLGRQIYYMGIEFYLLLWEMVEKLRYND